MTFNSSGEEQQSWDFPGLQALIKAFMKGSIVICNKISCIYKGRLGRLSTELKIMSMLKATSADTRSVYRSLLRSIQLAFKGDLEMVVAAREEVRHRLENSRNIEDKTEITKLQDEGREAAAFLRTSIMQLGSNQDGHLTVELDERHAGGVVEPIVPGMDLPKEGRKS